MKKFLLVLAFASLLTACGEPTSTVTPSSTAEVSQTISLENFAFNPKAITVKVGDTVQWTNTDSTPHTVTSDTFDSGSLAQGASFSYTFDKAGTVDYHCSLHPSMTGTINVQ